MNKKKKSYASYDLGGYLNPALQYGIAGSQFGPIGAGIGAGVGLIQGAITSNQDKMANQSIEDKLALDKSNNEAKRFNNLNNFSTPYHLMYGGELSSYANGGIQGVQPNAEIETEEVVQVPNPSMTPLYMDGGTLEPLSLNAYKANGNTHAEGGIDTKLPNGTRIFSDKLNSSLGKSFAEEASKLEKMKGKAQKNKTINNLKDNTISRIDKRLDDLFNEQELLKTKDSSPKESFGKGGTYANGVPITSNSSIYNGETFTEGAGIPNNISQYGNAILPYLGNIAQGLSSLGKKEYLPERRINESIVDQLPGDREAELATRSAQVRNREGLFTSLKGVNQGFANSSKGAVISNLFSNYQSNQGDLSSREAQLKAGFDINKVNTTLNIENTNLNQARLEDINRLKTDANVRNIGKQALNNTSAIAQKTKYEKLLMERDKIALKALTEGANPGVKENFLKNLGFKYKSLFE